VCLLVLLAAPVSAHAVLVSATPGADATVEGSAVQVKLRFNLRIDGERSRLVLVRPDGRERALKTAQPSPDLLSSEKNELKPGSYTVQWQVLAEDGHISRGEFHFLVK
jgi:methionine-rich copper-binding protein CopC